MEDRANRHASQFLSGGKYAYLSAGIARYSGGNILVILESAIRRPKEAGAGGCQAKKRASRASRRRQDSTDWQHPVNVAMLRAREHLDIYRMSPIRESCRRRLARLAFLLAWHPPAPGFLGMRRIADIGITKMLPPE